MNYRKQVIVIVVGTAVILGGVFFLQSQKSGLEDSTPSYQFNYTTVSSDTDILGEGYKRFTHPKYGFSVEYPEELDITAFDESGGGETVIFQSREDESVALEEKVGFQIFISPFEEDSVLTLERIREDLPFATIEEPVEVIIGTKMAQNVPALLFWSEDPTIGRTREVWFVHDNYLYEITSFAHMDTLLADIFSTWTFNVE